MDPMCVGTSTGMRLPAFGSLVMIRKSIKTTKQQQKAAAKK